MFCCINYACIFISIIMANYIILANDPLKNSVKPSPDFDLYSHLKSNIKNCSSLCEIHDSKLTTYCIPCRKSICEVCRDSFHASHIHMEKKDVCIESKRVIDSVFNDLDKTIAETELFLKPENILKDVQAKVNREFDLMAERLDELKSRRLKELENVFGISTYEAKQLLSYMKNTKELLLNFLENQNDFFCCDESDDFDNFTFLTYYDVVNECDATTKEYLEIISSIKNQFRRYETLVHNKYSHRIQVAIDDCLEEQKKLEVVNSNLIILETPSGNLHGDGKQGRKTNQNNSSKLHYQDDFKNSLAYSYDRLGEDLYEQLRNKIIQIEEHIEEFKASIYDSFKKTGSLVEIEKMLKIYEDKTSKRIQYNSQVNSVKISQSKGSGLSRSKQSLKLAVINSPEKERTHETRANHISQAVNIIKEEDEDHKIEDEDSHVFGHKDLIDVGLSKNKKLHENKELLKITNMFKPKPKLSFKAETSANKFQYLPLKKEDNNINNNHPCSEDKFKSSKLVEILKENQRISETIKSKNDCNLKISTIKRFYSFSVLEFIRKRFYRGNNKHQSSHILFCEKSEKSTNANDIIKIFEGTCDIQIFDRVQRKIVRRAVKLDKKKLGTNVFPNGCRTYYSAGKLYISGGKDISGDKNLFWSYCLKEDKIEKLISMAHPRSFHTMVYHENLRSLLVFGGENNNTCEMYDFYLNLWSPLPNLNIPRANLQIYMDKVATFGYALCGIIGPITNPTYSDQIELLDLVDMNQGWAIINYKNKSNVDLRANESRIYSLTEDKLLIYGANESRCINKIYCIFDLRTFIMRAVDEEELGDFKINSILTPTKTLERAFNKSVDSK